MKTKLLLFLALCHPIWAQPAPPTGDPPSPAVSPSPSPSPDAAEEEPELQFRGYLSTGYSLNFQQPSTGKNALRGYDFDDRKLKLDVLNLNLDYALDRPGYTGFRLDLAGGGSMPRVDAAAGLFRDPATGVSTADFDIRQAFLSHTFENGFRLDAGKFATHFGYEIMDGVDGRNPNGTRTWSYTYSPFTHTGVRMSYPISDKLSMTAVAVMGADQFQNVNQSISFGGQLNYHPTSDFSLIFNYLTGPEQYRNDTFNRQLLDAVVNYRIVPEVNLGLHALTGTEQFPYGTAHWNGVVAYVMADFTDEFSLNFREEFFNDPFGARLGAGQSLSAFTITPEYRVTPDWIFRLDIRFDHSTSPSFDRRGLPVDYQNTLFFNQILKF